MTTCNSFSDRVRGVVAVHAGAGFHSPRRAGLYEALCKKACREAWILLERGASATEVVARAVQVLEDHPATNAGLGSNLTLAGRVECDAGIMDGRSLNFAAVGCASGIRNPILVTHKLLEEQNKGFRTEHGLVVPSLLVGPAVREWAGENGLEEQLVEEGTLLTDNSVRDFKKYMKRIRTEEVDVNNAPAVKSVAISHNETHPTMLSTSAVECTGAASSLEPAPLLDTVGAVCIDWQGHVASAVSSGGVLLKQPGRVGQAAVYGCGCWSDSIHVGSDYVRVAASASGCGEQLIKTQVAQQCSMNIVDSVRKVTSDDSFGATVADSLHSFFRGVFLDSRFLAEHDQRLCGILLLVSVDHERGESPVDGASSRGGGRHSTAELLWCHSTRSMAVGYMSSGTCSEPQFVISRLGCGCSVGCTSETHARDDEEKKREGRQCVLGGCLLTL